MKSKPESLDGGSQRLALLVGTLGAGLLALTVVAAATVELRNLGGQRGWPMLYLTAVVTLALFAIALFNAARPPLRRNDRAARVVLIALMVTTNAIAASYAFLAVTGGARLDWLVLVPVPTWIICAWYVPFLVDSPVLSDRASPTGWKKIAGMRMVYSDPDDEALWMEFSGGIRYFAINHTPNLGHRWGRVVGLVFVLLIVVMIAGIVALL